LVDKNLVMRKLADLEQYLDQIREFSKITQRTYASEWKTQRVVERTLQMMIEVCADIAAHVVYLCPYVPIVRRSFSPLSPDVSVGRYEVQRVRG